MSRVRNRDTDLERILRSALHRRGLRFRKHTKELPGRPDIVFPSKRVAVFVDGDFWHGYRFADWRESVSEFWATKIEANRKRDKRNERALRALGWKVVRVWQHELKRDVDSCVARVVSALDG